MTHDLLEERLGVGLVHRLLRKISHQQPLAALSRRSFGHGLQLQGASSAEENNCRPPFSDGRKQQVGKLLPVRVLRQRSIRYRETTRLSDARGEAFFVD